MHLTQIFAILVLGLFASSYARRHYPSDLDREELEKRLWSMLEDEDSSENDVYDDVDEYELLKRFLFKKKTTTAPTTTTTTASGFGINNLVPKPNGGGGANSGGSGSGGLSDLMNGLLKTTTTTRAPVITTTKKSGGALDSLIGGLITTKGTPVPIVTPKTTPKTNNPCLPNPCQNKGQCQLDSTSNTGFSCICPTLFTGELCETMNNCFNNPCKNGGTCHNMRTKYYCSCATGFSGDQCEKGSGGNSGKKCSNNPCLNGGTCHQFSFGQYCQCPATHYGNNCENAFTKPYSGGSSSYNGGGSGGMNSFGGGSNSNACARNPCRNGARCESLLNGFDYYCHCKAPYTGKNCEKDAYAKPGIYGYMMDLESRSESDNTNDEAVRELNDMLEERSMAEARDLYDIQQIRSLEESFNSE